MALLVYIRTPTNTTPVELELEATVRDVYNLPEVSDYGYTVYHQGNQLTNMDDMLADIGVSMESTLEATKNVNIKKICTGRKIAYALLDNDTIINSRNDNIKHNVTSMGKATTIFMESDKLGNLSRYDIKDIICGYHTTYYVLDKHNRLYYVNKSTHIPILTDIKAMRNIQYTSMLMVWSDTTIYLITKSFPYRRKPTSYIDIQNIIDVSGGRHMSAKVGHIGVLTNDKIILIRLEYGSYMMINRVINISNIKHISLMCDVLGCMNVAGDITLYHEDESEFIGNADGFALVPGTKNFGRVNAELIHIK